MDFQNIIKKIPILGNLQDSEEKSSSKEQNYNSAIDLQLHGDALIQACKEVGLKKPIAEIYRAVKSNGVTYTSVYCAFHKDIFNHAVFETLDMYGVKHNRKPKKKGRPSKSERKGIQNT